MAKTPEQRAEEARHQRLAEERQAADDAFAQSCFERMRKSNTQKPEAQRNQSLIRLLRPQLNIQNPTQQQIQEAREAVLKARIKANTPITLTVQGNQTLEITFQHAHTSFVFSTERPEGCKESVEFMGDFHETFKAQNENNEPYYEVIAHDEEALVEALKAMAEKGIRAQAITLYDQGVKKEFTPEEVEALYEKRPNPPRP